MHSIRRLHPIRRLVVPVAALALVCHSAHAQNIWDGDGGDGNWTTALNWDNDIAPTFPQALTFAGGVNLNTFNDFVGAVVNGITFDATAGAFTLGGNQITLGGNILNSSGNLQTFSLPVLLNATRILDGDVGGLALTGGLSGSAASGAMQEATLRGSGTITGVLSSGPNPNAGLRLNVNHPSANSSSWTIGGNATSSFGGQLVVTRGTMNFGSATEAPDVTVTRVSTGNINEFMTVGVGGFGTNATFNMNNGNLTLNDGQNNTGSTSIRLALGNTSAATGASGEATWNQTGGTVTLQGFNLGGSPGVFIANQNGTTATMNIGGGANPTLFDAANAPVMAAVRGIGTINIENNGTLRITGTGTNAGNAVLGLTVNDDRQVAGALQSVGTVNLNTGGTLEAAQIRMTANRGGQAVVAIFNFNGGVWKFTSAASLVYGGSGTGNDTATVNVGAGGAVIDKNGFDGTIALPLVHQAALGATQDGGLDVRGLGTLTLNGINTYNGNTRVREGGLTIGAAGSLANTPLVTIDSGAALTLQSTTGLGIGTVLDLVNGSILNLDFTGEQILSDILLNGVSTGNGAFDAAALSALMPGGTFTGTGVLVVPEPSTAALAGLGLLALIGWRRSRNIRG